MITTITATEFDGIDPTNQVIVHDYPRRFACLHLPHAASPLGICWRSELIEPILVQDSNSSVLWVGIDQRLVCVTMDGAIRFSIALASSLLQILNYTEFTVALCESQVLVINENSSIRRMDELPDIPDSVDLQDGRIIILLLDGSSRTLTV